MATDDEPGAGADNGDLPDSNMTVRQAGKIGGEKVRDRYGPGFYQKIGRKGGLATRARHGAEFYEIIGTKGGKTVKEKYGAAFYESIGHKGGQSVKALIAAAKAHLGEGSGKKRRKAEGDGKAP